MSLPVVFSIPCVSCVSLMISWSGRVCVGVAEMLKWDFSLSPLASGGELWAQLIHFHNHAGTLSSWTGRFILSTLLWPDQDMFSDDDPLVKKKTTTKTSCCQKLHHETVKVIIIIKITKKSLYLQAQKRSVWFKHSSCVYGHFKQMESCCDLRPWPPSENRGEYFRPE